MKPVLMPVIEGNIPDLLTANRQWVAWSWIWNSEKAKWDKPPLIPFTDRHASTTDPSTWRKFADAIRFHQAGRSDGIGFVLTASDPFVAVDLDKCVSAGVVEPWASDIIGRLASYTEISPSGRGIRILCRGTLPPHGRRKGQIEMYCDGRYVTITGHRLLTASAEIEDRTKELALFHANVFGTKPQRTLCKPKDIRPATLDDLKLLDRAKSAANGLKFQQLWSGDTRGYSSASEADLALISMIAFWSGPDVERIDRLFQASGLCRDKWLERKDYRVNTINVAIERGTFYKPPAPTPSPIRSTPAIKTHHHHHRGNAHLYGLKPKFIYCGEGAA